MTFHNLSIFSITYNHNTPNGTNADIIQFKMLVPTTESHPVYLILELIGNKECCL